MAWPSSHTEVVQELREHQGLLLSMLIFFKNIHLFWPPRVLFEACQLSSCAQA